MSRRTRRRPGGGSRGARQITGRRDRRQATAPVVAAAITGIELRQRFPRLAKRHDATLDAIRRDARRTVCPHVDGAAALIACAEHPAVGLLCLACAKVHVARHSWEAEHRCDECGQLDHTVHPLGATATAVLLPAFDRRGHPGLVLGQVYLAGLGVCTRCYPGVAA